MVARVVGCVIWPRQVVGMGPGKVFGNRNPHLVGGADKASGNQTQPQGVAVLQSGGADRKQWVLRSVSGKDYLTITF